MIDHRPADPATSRRSRAVHRLQLGMVFTKLLQRSDGQQIPVKPEAKERDSRIEPAIDAHGMDVLGEGLAN